MKGDSKVIQMLNQVLGSELVAINQYFLHARMFKNWGLNALNERTYRASIAEMKHADHLIERILFLQGLPNLQDMGRLMIGENSEEILNCDLTLEQSAITTLKQAIACCESQADFVSRDLLESVLESEENHLDWLETQLELIQSMGIENYLQSQM